MADFFISLSGRDKAWGDWIAWEIRQAGFSVAYQHWDFQTGENFLLEMEKAGRESGRVVVLLSENYFASQFTLAELSQALYRQMSTGKTILVPVRIGPVDLAGSLVGPLAFIDLTAARSEAEARAALLEGLREKGPPAAAPAFPQQSQGPAAQPGFPGALYRPPSVTRAPACNPDRGPLAPKLCDRLPQIGDFRLALQWNADCSPQVFLIQGGREDLPESLAERLRYEAADRDGETGAILHEAVPWPVEGTEKRRRWYLVEELFRRFRVVPLPRSEDELSAKPLLQSPFVAAYEWVVISHRVFPENWGLETLGLLKWYSKFWQVEGSGASGAPRFLIVIAATAAGGQTEGIAGLLKRLWSRGREVDPVEAQLASIMPSFEPGADACAVRLPRLRPVLRRDVELWMEEVRLTGCLSRDQREARLTGFFRGAPPEGLPMVRVERFLEQMLEEVR